MVWAGYLFTEHEHVVNMIETKPLCRVLIVNMLIIRASQNTGAL